MSFSVCLIPRLQAHSFNLQKLLVVICIQGLFLLCCPQVAKKITLSWLKTDFKAKLYRQDKAVPGLHDDNSNAYSLNFHSRS